MRGTLEERFWAKVASPRRKNSAQEREGATMRDGATRAKEIEEAASSLVAWSHEFVGDVYDHRGNRIYLDWREVLGDLSKALKPLVARREGHGDR